MSLLRESIYQHRWLLLIVLLSVTIKLFFLLQGGVVNPDSATYIAAAEKHAQGLFGEGIRLYRMPFYPLLLAVTHTFVSDWILAGQLLSIVPLVLALLPLYVLTMRLFDQHSALWTALLFAVLPVFNDAGTSIIRGPLFLLFILLAVMFLVFCVQEQNTWAGLGLAMCTVLAILFRIEGILFPFTALFAVCFVCWRLSNNLNVLIRVIVGFVLIPVFFLLMLWCLKWFGISTSSRLSEILYWVKSLTNLDLFSRYQYLMQTIKEFQQTLPSNGLHNNLLEVTRHYAPLIYILGIIEMLIKAVFPTSLLAIFSLRWRPKEQSFPERLLVSLPCIGFVLLNILYSVVYDFTSERYLWIPIVLILPWIGYGTGLWWQMRCQWRIIASLVVVLIVVTPFCKTVAIAARTQDITVVEAGRWLSEYDQRRDLSILYNDRRLPLYADRVSDVTKIHNIKFLKEAAFRDEEVEIIALHLSNKKSEDLTIQGFEVFKSFQGVKRTVVILKRRVE